MKEITPDLNHNLIFYCSCVCHKIRSLFRVLGINNFGLPSSCMSNNVDEKAQPCPDHLWQCDLVILQQDSPCKIERKVCIIKNYKGKLIFFAQREVKIFTAVWTVKLRVLTGVYNIEINFFQKVTGNKHWMSSS